MKRTLTGTSPRRSWLGPRRRLARPVRAAAVAAAPVVAGAGAGMALPAPAPTAPGRSRTGRLGQAVAEVVLTLAALAGLAGLAATALAARADLRPLVVRSGSMAPTVPTGSMVLVQRVPAADLRVGDVVAVDRPDGGRVMHRIVAITPTDHGAMASLTLKGDANDEADPQPVAVIEADRLAWHLPWAGRAASWLATAPGGFALGCLLTGLAAVILRRDGRT